MYTMDFVCLFNGRAADATDAAGAGGAGVERRQQQRHAGGLVGAVGRRRRRAHVLARRERPRCRRRPLQVNSAPPTARRRFRRQKIVTIEQLQPIVVGRSFSIVHHFNINISSLLKETDCFLINSAPLNDKNVNYENGSKRSSNSNRVSHEATFFSPLL